MLSTDEEDNSPLIHRAEVRNSLSFVRDWAGCIVATFLIIMGITCIIVISVYKAKVKDEYGIVLDAGSTHTNMFVYKWTVNDVVKGTAVVKEIGECVVKDKDNEVAGISSYVSNPDEAGQSLQSCITSTAEKLIPSYLRNRSPIYLGATAGMRLLKEMDAAAASKILASVRKSLKSSPFMFKDDYARIISGEEEGLSSWITVNYLNGAFNNSQENSVRGSSQIIPLTVGALDMGGASTQITFTSPKAAQPSSKLKLYGTEYQLYTHSYLCYGKKEAEDRFYAQLVKESHSSTKVDNPCGPKGYRQNITLTSLWASPCVKGNTSNRITVTLVGTGNHTLCSKEVSKLFNFTSCGGNSSCSFDGVYQPTIDGKEFFAFSGYNTVIKDLNLTSNASLDQLQAATKNICEKSWDEIKTIPTKFPYFLPFYCFDAQYVFTILSRGYHFQNSTANLQFNGTVNGLSLGWALGFMINATNLLPIEKPVPVSIHVMQSGVFLVVVIVGSLLVSSGILICLLSAGKIYRQRNLNVQGLVL
ncbi:ectonucleoside triphosphate diphosphohydrolase 8-like isoform X2 [Stylophora pistillata]|uniref:ectonucleoside triphosphate diphosphohydrolase 8-like isoform X2 n=1 Tax=Stylophora pistillata TaxID=50429 RepID=UPI000C04F455|nr:ectonucleoside triphosphate diphosphohydrolase 8-like isoform X2 [Stylophora pistillata]